MKEHLPQSFDIEEVNIPTEESLLTDADEMKEWVPLKFTSLPFKQSLELVAKTRTRFAYIALLLWSVSTLVCLIKFAMDGNSYPLIAVLSVPFVTILRYYFKRKRN